MPPLSRQVWGSRGRRRITRWIFHGDQVWPSFRRKLYENLAYQQKLPNIQSEVIPFSTERFWRRQQIRRWNTESYERTRRRLCFRRWIYGIRCLWLRRHMVSRRFWLRDGSRCPGRWSRGCMGKIFTIMCIVVAVLLVARNSRCPKNANDPQSILIHRDGLLPHKQCISGSSAYCFSCTASSPTLLRSQRSLSLQSVLSC